MDRRSLDDIGDFRQPSEGALVDYLPDMPFAMAREQEKLTSAYLQERGLRPGPLRKKLLTDALNARSRLLVEAAISLAAAYEPVSLLTCLVAAYESLRIHLGSIAWGVTGKLPLEPSMIESARSDAVVAPSLGISLRLVIEIISARPPVGEKQATRAAVTALWAYAWEVLRVGSTSDFIHHELIPSELSAHAGELVLPEMATPHSAKVDRMVQLHNATTDPFIDLFGNEQRMIPMTAKEEATEQTLFDRMGIAMAQIAGVDLPTCIKIIASLAGFAGLQPHNHPNGYYPGGLNIATEDDLVAVIAYLHKQEPERVRELLHFLCIEPKPGYPDQDDMPWVFGRRRSYQSRPLVRAPGDRDIIWSGFHTYCSVEVITGQLIHASLPGVEPRSPLGYAMGEFSKWRGEQFEAAVLDVVRSDLRLRACRVAKLGGKPLRRANGQDLGDIDVLAADPNSRTLLNVEAKASAPARTPREIANEINRFTVKHKGTDADRVLERAALVEENVESALAQLGVQSTAEGWHVRSLIVLQTAPFAGKLRDVDVPTLSYDELAQIDLCQWIALGCSAPYTTG